MKAFKSLIACSLFCFLTPPILYAQTLNCKVAIVGGGAAGMHSFFRLAPHLKEGVCLFEANNYFGGRIKDIASPPPFGSPAGTPSPGVYGIGALRVQETQNVLFNLATELGFPLQDQKGNFEVPYGPSRVFARGEKTENVNSFLRFLKSYATPRPNANFPDPSSGYPAPGDGYPDSSTAVSCSPDGNNYNGCFSDAYYHALLNPKYLPEPGEFNTNREWLKSRNVLRPEGFKYLTDTFRFRGDFQNGVDPISYIDFLTEDWDVCCNPTYPEGGMSMFIGRMLAEASPHSQNFFLLQPVSSINKQGNKYLLKTPDFDVVADSVIIATSAVGLSKMKGDIIKTIKNDPHFKAIVPVRVIAINNWWKTAWWDQTKSRDGSPIDRAWSTKDGIPNVKRVCFNFFEGPHSKYENLQFATRSVYNDDTVCSQFWGNLNRTKGIAGVNQRIVKELNAVFPELPKKLCNNGQSAGLCVEDITQTAYEDWPDAWYWLKGPTRLTNAEVAIWALEPIPGEKISLAGDSYNPNRTTWSDGAFKSSINTLDFNYSNMPGHKARIAKILPEPLSCNSVVIENGVPTYVPFNANGEFNANCPLTTGRTR